MVLGMVLLLGWAMYPALRVQYEASRQYQGLEAQYETLKERNDHLRAEVADLKTPAGVERAARESLGFAKRGEHVYVVMPETSQAAEPGRPVEQGATSSDPLGALLDAIFGLAR